MFSCNPCIINSCLEALLVGGKYETLSDQNKWDLNPYKTISPQQNNAKQNLVHISRQILYITMNLFFLY